MPPLPGTLRAARMGALAALGEGVEIFVDERRGWLPLGRTTSAIVYLQNGKTVANVLFEIEDSQG